MSAVIQKYLARHAAAEAAQAGAIARALGRAYDHVCVVPALGESERLIDGLAPPGQAHRALYVLVVNATDSADVTLHAHNHELMAALRRRARELVTIADEPAMWLCRGLVAEATDTLLDVLIIDRASPGRRLPEGQGVGLARCIGGDVALALHHAGCIRSRWIHTTDADVILPPRYFAEALAAPRDSVALTYPFWHQTQGTLGVALGLYEVSLRYYVLGLGWARSPDAHHTIGSTLAVDATAYAAVRGVPRRRAAEDFYLLSKLAKLGPVVRPRSAPIRIRQRLSQRAPFGTGPATARIAAELARGQPPRLYHPRSFAALRRWLEVLRRFARDPDHGLDLHAPGTTPLHARELGALEAALEALHARRALLDARARVTSPAGLARRIRGWFDAFRTLKLMHALRDAGLGDLPWTRALEGAPFVSGLADLYQPLSPQNVDHVRRVLVDLDSGP